MVGYRWSIFWVRLDPVTGSEQAGTRPVLIVSAEEVNQNLPVVTVLPLTSARSGRKVYPTEAFLPAEDTGLPQDSIAMAHQICTIANQRLGEQCGAVNRTEMREDVINALRRHLDI